MSDKKARDVMSSDCTCIGENDSGLDARSPPARSAAGAITPDPSVPGHGLTLRREEADRFRV